ncbi:hypothetical protein ACEVHA_028080 [Klebsiella pneumoniae]
MEDLAHSSARRYPDGQPVAAGRKPASIEQTTRPHRTGVRLPVTAAEMKRRDIWPRVMGAPFVAASQAVESVADGRLNRRFKKRPMDRRRPPNEARKASERWRSVRSLRRKADRHNACRRPCHNADIVITASLRFFFFFQCAHAGLAAERRDLARRRYAAPAEMHTQRTRKQQTVFVIRSQPAVCRPKTTVCVVYLAETGVQIVCSSRRSTGNRTAHLYPLRVTQPGRLSTVTVIGRIPRRTTDTAWHRFQQPAQPLPDPARPRNRPRAAETAPGKLAALRGLVDAMIRQPSSRRAYTTAFGSLSVKQHDEQCQMTAGQKPNKQS